jgi:CsoR family transcriptional regulator, copper-sensing transcriptional repressor
MAKKVKTTARRKSKPPKRPDPSAQLARLKRIRGQLEGIQRMIEGRRDCPEILVQTSAARAALRSLEIAILRDHIGHGIRQALREPGGTNAKLQELLAVFHKLTA